MTTPKTIQDHVTEVWGEHPGIGVKELTEKVQDRLQLGSGLSKKSVRMAKSVIPYRKILDEDDNDDANKSKRKEEDDDLFVQKKLEERQSLRISHEYDKADYIQRGLEKMGINIDDTLKTWKRDHTVFINRKKLNLLREESSTTTKLPSQESKATENLVCKMCGLSFPSRNLLFSHLRDSASGCGTTIFASGLSLPKAPSTKKKQEKKELHRMEKMKQKENRLKGKTAQHADADSCLWIGDLPLKWTRMGGKYRRLRALLRCYIPRDTPTPWVKVVVRKAYRKRISPSPACSEEKIHTINSQNLDEGYVQNNEENAIEVIEEKEKDTNNIKDEHDSNVRGEYLGYAIVVFRDAQEAMYVMNNMNGVTVTPLEVWPNNAEESVQDLLDEDPFVLKIQTVKNSDSYDSHMKKNHAVAKVGIPSTDEVTTITEIDHLLGKDRKQIHRSGRPVPNDMYNRLLHILQTLRWAVPNQRKGLAAERYLVLQTKVTNDPFYSDLRQACKELMDWADPEYFYSGIAVTKNFVSSPHYDECDQTFQYAVSLGEFQGGGQLCVEGHSDYDSEDDEPDIVNVVNTHMRIARVDGRNCHWVNPWSSGERYSLIFYDTSDRNRTPINRLGVDLNYLANE